MKPLLNKLPTPPTKHDRDYYTKLDNYLKAVYEFSEQLNGVVDWVEAKECAVCDSVDSVNLKVEEANSCLDNKVLASVTTLDEIVSSFAAQLSIVISEAKEETKLLKEDSRYYINNELVKFKQALDDVCAENKRLKSELDKNAEVLLEQQREGKLSLDNKVSSFTTQLTSVISEAKEETKLLKEDAHTYIGNELVKFKQALDDVCAENKRLKSELDKNTEVLSEQQREAKLLLAEVTKLKSSTNFRGKWSDVSGVVNVPFVVYHNGHYWNLLRSVRRVEAHEPSISDAWVQL